MTPCYRVGNNPYNTVLFYAYHLATRHQSAKMRICGNIAQMQIRNRHPPLKHLAFLPISVGVAVRCEPQSTAMGALLSPASKSIAVKSLAFGILHQIVPTLFLRFF